MRKPAKVVIESSVTAYFLEYSKSYITNMWLNIIY